MGLVATAEHQQYIASFYFVTATMMAVGYGEITGTNSDERVFCIILQLFGATSFGFILSSVTTLLESANPREQEVTKKMAEIKEWLTGRAIPRSLKSEVRDHFNYAMSKKSIFNEAEILGNMPCSIRIDVIQQSYDAWLRRLAHPFPDEEMALRIELVQQLQPQQVMYDEVLIESGEISAEVYIVLHGCLEAVADANRTDLVPASNWVTNCLNRGDDHSSRFRADHSNTFATISSEEMRDEMDDGDEEFVQEAQVMKEVLCGVYGNGDLMGECQAAPIMVRGFSSRSDVLGIHRDALAYVLSRFPGALQRYDAMEDRIQLELVKVFESPESTDPVFERPVKSLVLIAGVCASSNDLPHALVKDLVRAGRKKEKELSKKALWAGSRSKTQGSLFSDGPIISKGDGTTDLAKFSRDPRADRDLITGEVTRSASSASPKVRLARSPTQQLGGTLLRWRVSLNLLCQFLCPKGRSNKRGDSNILYHTRRLNPDTGEEEEVEEKQADILKRFVIPPHQRYKFRWDLIVGVLIVYRQDMLASILFARFVQWHPGGLILVEGFAQAGQPLERISKPATLQELQREIKKNEVDLNAQLQKEQDTMADLQNKLKECNENYSEEKRKLDELRPHPHSLQQHQQRGQVPRAAPTRCFSVWLFQFLRRSEQRVTLDGDQKQRIIAAGCPGITVQALVLLGLRRLRILWDHRANTLEMHVSHGHLCKVASPNIQTE
ncbi:unnamed protein product [Polarella glacialis]|uniref:Cyclic nucleotide-binding domain-containing protein n=1 Tax=Polarella glacialis TaxID=89957 RepID=A0A813KDQ5_POLGL|nr:unnamed protein product [Polarella glacialis]